MSGVPEQCKDIPDVPVLRFIAGWRGEWCFILDREITERSVLHAMPDGTPWKLARAKMRQLVRRGLVDGCACGCRGDFTITEQGEAYLAEHLG